ncbi:porin family protein [Carboxylicivirga taeanensis]|uniref:porin family protein n=1 Tax=Carboxylicivirga taeanensis TaxID=1416875 RepID=UPI003F6DF4C1
MLKNEKNIDAVFKRGLSDYEVVPEGYVWDSIEKTLGHQRQQKRALLLWISLAAACIVGLIGLSVGLLFRVSEPLKESTMIVMEPALGEKAVDSEQRLVLGETQQALASGQTDVEVNKSNIVSTAAGAREEKQADVKQFAIEGFKTNLPYLASNTEVQIKHDYKINEQLKQEVKKQEYYPLYYPSAPSAREKQKATISIGGVVSPAFSSKVSYGSGPQNYLKSNVAIDESGISSLGGGVQVRVSKGSRWSFESGVLYSQVGQSVESVTKMSAGSAYTQSSPGRAAVYNSLGNVIASENFSEQQVSAGGANLMEEAVMNYDNAKGSLKQTLDYIEVPVMARYSLFKQFPYLSVAGGFSSNFLVDNTAYAIDGSGRDKIGETSDIKPFVISSSVGVGIDIPVTKALRLSFEPRFKYFLNSVSSNDNRSFQPYSFGVYGGLTFVVK